MKVGILNVIKNNFILGDIMSKDKLRVFNKNNNNMYYLEEEDYIILDYNKRNGWTLKTLWTDNEPKIIAYSDEIIIMDYILNRL